VPIQKFKRVNENKALKKRDLREAQKNSSDKKINLIPSDYYPQRISINFKFNQRKNCYEYHYKSHPTKNQQANCYHFLDLQDQEKANFIGLDELTPELIGVRPHR
jgi:hypothetical protein